MTNEEEKEVKEYHNDNIKELENNINNLLSEIDRPIDDLLPKDDSLPTFNMGIDSHNYENDLETVKLDARDTLKCLANLYLDKKKMKDKNINNIIKNDSILLADLNFTISCARRALISCMTQLDMGVNDPEMYKSVSLFQKEMRDTIKMAYDLQKKMKEFYKELKPEMDNINSGEVEENNLIDTKEDLNLIGDPRRLNDIIDQFKTDHTLLNE